MEQKSEKPSWRPWSDHPFVVGALLLFGLVSVVFAGLTYFASWQTVSTVTPRPVEDSTENRLSDSATPPPAPVDPLPDFLGQSLGSAMVKQLFARLDPHATFSIPSGTLYCFKKQGLDLLFDGTLQKLIFYSGAPGDDHLRHERYADRLPFNLNFDLARNVVSATLQPYLQGSTNSYPRSKIDSFKLPGCRLEVHYSKSGATASIHSVHLLRSEFAEKLPEPEAPTRGTVPSAQ